MKNKVRKQIKERFLDGIILLFRKKIRGSNLLAISLIISRKPQLSDYECIALLHIDMHIVYCIYL